MTLLLSLVLFFILFAGATVFVVVLGVDVQATGPMLWMQTLSQLLVFLLPACLCAWLFNHRMADGLRLPFGRANWGHLLAALLLLLLAMPAIDLLTQWNDGWHFGGVWERIEQLLRQQGERSQQLVERFLYRQGVGALVVNLLVLALVPALCEEFFFRGALQNMMQRWLRGNVHAAVWLTAAIFSLAHGEVFAFVPRFALGVLLGYLYVYSGTIWVNVAVHFLNNALVVVCSALFCNGLTSSDWAEEMGFPLWVALAGLTLAAALFWFVFLRRRGGLPPAAREASEPPSE